MHRIEQHSASVPQRPPLATQQRSEVVSQTRGPQHERRQGA